MNTYVVSFERTANVIHDGHKMMIREVATEEVKAESYVPLPQKVVNFYKNRIRNTAGDNIVATYYDVVSVKEKGL